MKLPKYDFKHGWPQLLLFLIVDTLIFMFILGITIFLDNPDIANIDINETLQIGKYEITYYDATLIVGWTILSYLLCTLVKTIWSITFDMAMKFWKKNEK